MPVKPWIYSIFVVFSLSQITQVSAISIKENSPLYMPAYSKCNVKDLGKVRKNNSEICTKQSGKNQWEPALTISDVYQVSEFCSKVIDLGQCEWTERAGLALVRGQGARDACVKLLRAVVYAIAKANKENLDPNKLGGQAITNNKKFCWDEKDFPK